MPSTAPKDASADTKLTVLHDHYKETFGHIRERERQRDRLFFIVIGLITLIFIEILYPRNLTTLLDTTEFQGIDINITALPVHVIVSATWTVLAAILLRFYQSVAHIERQYEYLHELEEKGLAPAISVGEPGNIYRREGYHYLKTRARFSDWVWLFYSFGFPLAVLVGTGSVFFIESKRTPPHTYHLVYDIVLAFSVWITIIMYQYARYQDLMKRT